MGLSLTFLGTGPSGGRPGRGRSRRRESSLLLASGGERVLVDVTRDFAEQSALVPSVELVLITHGHRDACGGVPQLERWLARRDAPTVPLLASAATLDRLRPGDHLRMIPVAPGRAQTWRGWSISALEVAHAPDCVTFAWRLRRGGATVVYASDVARLDERLRRFADGADVLIIDGAMWTRRLFTHLTIQQALPVLARWRVRRLVFTQLGRSTPDHEALDAWLRGHCRNASAAFDGLRLWHR